MERIVGLLWFCFIFFFPTPGATYSMPSSNISSNVCHKDEALALLRFKNSFTISNTSSYYCVLMGEVSYAKTRTWREGTDCCHWDGVTCDSSTGHVAGIDLSCSQLTGMIHPNSSIFILRHLRSLNLAANDFSYSSIAPNFGEFPLLKYLNLSSSGFSGKVPSQISQLSKLRSLDLSFLIEIKMLDFQSVIRNLTQLRELHLSGVLVNSEIPQSIMKLSSLMSLKMSVCSLQGEFPTSILHLPSLRVLDIWNNYDLHANFRESNWSSPLEMLDFTNCSFSGKLPDSLLQQNTLRVFRIGGCSFTGVVPNWLWNVAEVIDLSGNIFSGELPISMDANVLSSLTMLDVSGNFMNSSIPSWLFTAPSLQFLYLGDNEFSGELPEILRGANSLVLLDLSNNKIHGSIPHTIFSLVNLKYLLLSSNNFSGIVELNLFSELKNLEYLDLSFNQITTTTAGATTSSSFSWPNLTQLYLSSCNISEIPTSIKGLKNLEMLDLSYNYLHGELPAWLVEMGNAPIGHLNLSYNSLTGGLQHLLSWKSMYTLDVNFNLLQGLIPPLPLSLANIFASSNSITGSIPSSICKIDGLQYLDLSNNSLRGDIPQCVGNFTYLLWLNLGSNKLNGPLPSFTTGSALTTLALNGNQLEGNLPRSLGNCKQLRVLDLGNNRLNGSFPYWLGSLPELQVLLLHSNNFHGTVSSSKVEHQFHRLQILDLSNNEFTGALSSQLLNSFSAMKNISVNGDKQQYLGESIEIDPTLYLQESISLAIKGSDRKLSGILNILTAIDISNNKFSGIIPEVIGTLASLRWLNLSYNNFSGSIPQSLAGLNVLESLDLRSNQIAGQIPQALANLKFLEYFNVSDNKLAGIIPQGNQFASFGNDSYLGNPGLCGFPLSKNCGQDEEVQPLPPPSPSEQEDPAWESVVIGYGFGLVMGLIVGYFAFVERTPFWILRLAVRIEYCNMQIFKKRGRRQQRRTYEETESSRLVRF
ncbi:hypothetical protein Drorol1_Dr00014703 [Drosera rotundifolia]